MILDSGVGDPASATNSNVSACYAGTYAIEKKLVSQYFHSTYYLSQRQEF